MYVFLYLRVFFVYCRDDAIALEKFKEEQKLKKEKEKEEQRRKLEEDEIIRTNRLEGVLKV